MAKMNKVAEPPKTHEGAKAARITTEQKLTRSVMACFLWEKSFYEEGEDIAERIRKYCVEVSAEFIADLAIRARHDMKLRHIPLFLLVQLLKKEKVEGLIVRDVISKVVSRVDELAELLVLYANDNGVPVNKIRKIDNQLKRGIKQSFAKFDEYNFGKYKGGEVRLRDVIRLVHPKAENEERNALYKRITSETLETPNTWETRLSAGEDKKIVFTELMQEQKLGGLALLRNLHNMESAGVDRKLVLETLKKEQLFSKVLPFRFLSAARNSSTYEAGLNDAMLKSIESLKELSGTTAVCVDCSGSMGVPVSSRSTVTRLDAAASLSALIKGDVRLYAFGSVAKEIKARKGLAGLDEVKKADVGHSTNIPEAVAMANKNGYDRIIVITDEQIQGHYGKLPKPLTDKAYFINVGVDKNGVGYGDWTNISGFSEGVLRYIQELEESENV